ncbi:hypothetical protein [Lichenihabitans psoromatis]|uniref:hypothetical protein n=1 Tax=Lichenihabitans psoromatis TaxID=2528642 RepID=UPI0010384D01|nr:hypothetical protein [Lichenihabitans psoromatis]
MGLNILAKERADSICGAIMRLDKSNPKLGQLISATEAFMDHDLVWGATGPKLLSKVFGRSEVFGLAAETNVFFPIAHDDFWKVFLPEYRNECEAACANADTAHLWNNIVDRLGVWKKIAPPKGSYLSARFEADETLEFFTDTYPEAVMRQMIENWHMRKTGEDLGIRGLSRQIVPSAFRTARRYWPARA